MITLKENILDGKRIAYTSETVFIVQVGRRAKGAYKHSYVFIGDLPRALFYYNALNLGNGYKKRLLMPSASRNPILVRQGIRARAEQLSFSFMPKAKRQVKGTILAQAKS